MDKIMLVLYEALIDYISENMEYFDLLVEILLEMNFKAIYYIDGNPRVLIVLEEGGKTTVNGTYLDRLEEKSRLHHVQTLKTNQIDLKMKMAILAGCLNKGIAEIF